MKNYDIKLCQLVLLLDFYPSKIQRKFMKILRIFSIVCLFLYAILANADNSQLLASQSAQSMYAELLEMKLKTKNDIMHLQIKLYTDAEMLAISNYLSTLK